MESEMTTTQAAWVRASGRWRLGQVVLDTPAEVKIRAQGGEDWAGPRDDVLWANDPVAKDDLTLLRHLHEPGVLACLQARAESDQPYTFLGSMLLAVNPVLRVAEPEHLAGTAQALGTPHPFAIAERAHQQMRFALRSPGGEFKPDQSVVVSGESGAGKTEAAKRVVRHLVAKAPQGSRRNSLLVAGLTEATAVFESFGNARTARNPNSSRFGKLAKLCFTADAALCSAAIDTFLLERSRVTSFAPGERNFHVFYGLLSGCSPQEKSQLALSRDAGAFRLLRETVSDDRDALAFGRLRTGLLALGIDARTQARVLATLAALLHLGNVGFADLDNALPSGPQCQVQDAPALARAAQLLRVTEDELAAALLTRQVRVGAERVETHLDCDRAAQARDGLLRGTYVQLFRWLVRTANAHLAARQGDPAQAASVGVLDIFGFESFAQNGLEQLLINFANEALQETFAKQVLVAEANLYREEGILRAAPETAPGSPCLALLEGPRGLLQHIDDLTSTPQPSDERLLQHLHKAFGAAGGAYTKPAARFAATIFQLQHYAGPVAYTADGFVRANTDRVPDAVRGLLSASQDHSVVGALFKNPAGPPPGRCRAGRSRSKSLTVCNKFKQDMSRLVRHLEATNCSFIRCIKPNQALRREAGCSAAAWFEPSFVAAQLESLSVRQSWEALRQGGFPMRVPYAELVRDYAPAVVRDTKAPNDAATFARALFCAARVDPAWFALGLSRAFFRAGSLDKVEAALAAALAEGGGRAVQQRFASCMARLRWRRALAKVHAQQHFACRLTTRRAAARAVQRFLRASIDARRCATAARVIQAVVRGRVGRARARRLLVSPPRGGEVPEQDESSGDSGTDERDDDAGNTPAVAKPCRVRLLKPQRRAERCSRNQDDHEAENNDGDDDEGMEKAKPTRHAEGQRMIERELRLLRAELCLVREQQSQLLAEMRKCPGRAHHAAARLDKVEAVGVGLHRGAQLGTAAPEYHLPAFEPQREGQLDGKELGHQLDREPVAHSAWHGAAEEAVAATLNIARGAGGCDTPPLPNKKQPTDGKRSGWCMLPW